RREPLHDLGVQVRAARSGREDAAARLAGPGAPARARDLVGVREPGADTRRAPRAGAAPRRDPGGDRVGADAAPAPGTRRARAQRRADRRARRAARQQPERALQVAPRRATQPARAPRGARSHRRMVMENVDLTLLRLLGPSEPELGCDECFAELDR